MIVNLYICSFQDKIHLTLFSFSFKHKFNSDFFVVQNIIIISCYVSDISSLSVFSRFDQPVGVGGGKGGNSCNTFPGTQNGWVITSLCFCHIIMLYGF